MILWQTHNNKSQQRDIKIDWSFVAACIFILLILAEIGCGLSLK